MPLIDPAAARLFRETYSADPTVVARAPGRVNLIGDHTDYNDGFVLPMAVHQEMQVAARALPQPTVHLTSDQFGTAAFRTDQDERAGGWSAYVQGVLRELGHSGGLQLAVASTIPPGAGLSSSAALEIGVARAVVALTGEPWNERAASQLAQRAENEWVGMQCGVMDQLSSASGRAGHALLIDCRSLELEPIRMPDTVEVVVLDTRSPRTLVESAYNERRAESRQAAAALGVASLRDATTDDVDRLSGIHLARARHVISENSRVLATARALRSGDLDIVARAMTQSHASLRDDYEVSSRALDAMVGAATGVTGLVGVRMTGGGFGGCCVALVERGTSDRFAARTLDRFRDASGIVGAAYVTTAADGASLLEGS